MLLRWCMLLLLLFYCDTQTLQDMAGETMKVWSIATNYHSVNLRKKKGGGRKGDVSINALITMSLNTSNKE